LVTYLFSLVLNLRTR